eukprot:gene51836-63384_t
MLHPHPPLLRPLLALATVVFSVRLLGERTPENRVESLATTVFGLVYVALLMQYVTRIVTPLPGDTLTPDSRLLIALWVIVVAKFCDMGALLSGMAFGRHKMSPLISPKKTWEGAIGGVLFSMATGAAFAQTASVKVEGAWARATVQGQKGTGAFMKLTAPEGAKLV